MDNPHQRYQAQLFVRLHQGPQILVLPNAWDVASARIFEATGFPAVATTSAGIAAALGYPDGEQISRQEMLAVVERITRTVAIPVSADIEAGYGNTLEEIAQTARFILEAGGVGINLEDGTGDPQHPLCDISHQVEKIRAIRAVADSAGIRLFINARTDVFFREVGGAEDRVDRAIRRGNAYREAGADGIYYMDASGRETIARLVKETPAPVNILAGPGALSVQELAELGVARVSVGQYPMRATLALIQKMARELLDLGTYTSMAQDEFDYTQVNQLFDRRAQSGS